MMLMMMMIPPVVCPAQLVGTVRNGVRQPAPDPLAAEPHQVVLDPGLVVEGDDGQLGHVGQLVPEIMTIMMMIMLIIMTLMTHVGQLVPDQVLGRLPRPLPDPRHGGGRLQQEDVPDNKDDINNDNNDDDGC